MLSASKSGSGLATGYNLTRSVRLRNSASAYLSRTMTAGTSVQKGTQSFWVKRGLLSTTMNVGMCAEAAVYPSGGAFNVIQFTSSDTLQVQCYNGSSNDLNLITTQVFRDPSAWYHIVVAWDTTQATAANRAIVYVNGTQVTSFSTATYPAQNTNFTGWGASNVYTIGTDKNNSNVFVRFFDGYLAEFNYVDGQQLAVTSFGSFNALTGVWQPASYTGSYGTNGFELNFTDNSALTTASNVGLGKDFSGNGNYWTTNNISITAGATYDSMTDVPTLTSATAANFAVLNPLDFNSGTVSNGNLQWAVTTAVGNGCFATFAFDIASTTNKYYWEFTISSGDCVFGIVPLTTLPSNTSRTGSYGYYTNGSKYSGTSASAYGATFTAGDIIGVTVGSGTITFYKNNTSQGSAFTSLTGNFKPAIWEVSGTFIANFGQRPFSYTPPTGFVALNTYNLPTSTIVKGNTVMDATLWAGDNTARSITNAAAFKPDLVWIKDRTTAGIWNVWFDSVRGVGNQLSSNQTDAELASASNIAGKVSAFNSNGFSVVTGSSSYYSVNQTAENYVGWQWQAGQGSTSSNTNGTITSTVSVNASAGFSVVTYTGTGTNGATVGHGLGVTPSMMIFKRRNTTSDWATYHASIGNTGVIFLNLTSATTTTANAWNNTSPTSSVLSLGVGTDVNGSGSTYVAYCWTPIAGYSAFGSYTGNGSTDGTFVYTGFRPRWILIKTSTDASGNWVIYDTARNTYNVMYDLLLPNSSAAESAYSNAYGIDVLSNGFKIRNATYPNGSGSTNIYAAFAENPFKNALAR